MENERRNIRKYYEGNLHDKIECVGLILSSGTIYVLAQGFSLIAGYNSDAMKKLRSDTIAPMKAYSGLLIKNRKLISEGLREMRRASNPLQNKLEISLREGQNN